MERPLDIINHFKVIEDNPSRLIYGEMIEKPDFSIVLPIYGYKDSLKSALLSIKNQFESNLSVQIILSDNKINEESKEKVLKLLNELNLTSIAYFLSEKELGQINNYNRAFLLSTSDYVCMLHDDDILCPDYLMNIRKILSYLKNNEDIGMIFENFVVFHDDDEIDFEKVKGELSIKRIKKNNVSLEGISLTGIPSCGYLLNRKAFINSGGFSPSYPCSGDAFLSAKMMLMKKRIMRFKNITGLYRVNNNISLKLNICQGFIKEDFLFGEDWKKHGTFFRRLLMNFFKNHRYSKNIDSKVFLFSSQNPEITIKSLDFRNKYKKYHRYGLMNISKKIFDCLFNLFNRNIRF